MSQDYKGIIQGNIDPIDMCKLIAKHYGGDDFKIRFGIDGVAGNHIIIEFTQNLDKAEKAKLPCKRKKKHRLMNMFINGACACDYADVTKDPMTYISLGHWGDFKEIIDPLVRMFGGYVGDEAKEDEWVRLPN